MTLEEIKALAAAKIAGQGDQVDLGGALKSIIDGLADAISGAQAAAPKVGIITENLDGPVKITADRYEELLGYAILRYDERDYLVCNDLTAIGGLVAGKDASTGALFTHQLTADDTGVLDACERIALYSNGGDNNYIELISA